MIKLETYLYENRSKFKRIGSSAILPETSKDIDLLLRLTDLPEHLQEYILENIEENSGVDYGRDFYNVKIEFYDFIICIEKDEYNARLFAQDTMEFAYDTYTQADKEKFKRKDFRTGYFMAARDTFSRIVEIGLNTENENS